MTQDRPEDTKTAPEPEPTSGPDLSPLSPAESAEARARMRRRNRMVAAVLVFFCALAFAWMLIRFGLR